MTFSDWVKKKNENEGELSNGSTTSSTVKRAGTPTRTFSEWVQQNNMGTEPKEDSTITVTKTGNKSFGDWARYAISTTYDNVDENYINTFLSDADDFLGSASKNYSSIGWGNATSSYDSVRKTAEGIKNRATLIKKWLADNANDLNRSYTADLFGILENYNSSETELLNAYKNAADFYGQFKSENAYNSYLKQQKERERKLNYDTTADEQEIAELNRIVDEYYASVSSGRNGMSGSEYARKVKDGENKLIKYFNDRYGDITSIEEIEALIASKQKNVEDIKTFQKYASTPLADDFEEYSLAGSKMADGTDFVYEVLGTPHGTDNYIEHYRKFYADNPSFRDSYGAGQIGDNASFALAMTDEEVKIYNYYLAKEGKKKANEYLSYIEDTVNDRVLGGYAVFADQHPVIASLNSIGTSLGSGLEYVGDAIKYKTGIEDEMDTNRMANITNAMRGAVSEKASWEIAGWDAGKFLYNTAMSGLDSAAAMFIPGKLGGVALGLSAAAQGTNDALERGMDSEQAFWNGLFSGVFEGLFETVSIGQFKSLKEVNPDTLKDIAKNIGKSMLTNASEETFTEIANIAYDTIANGEFANYTLDDLKNGAWVDALGQIIEAGGSGALMGVGFGAVGSTFGYAKGKVDARRKSNEDALKTYGNTREDVKALISEALELDPNNSLAKRLQKKLDGGKDLSGAELSSLVKRNESALVKSDTATIQKAAAQRLTELGETGDIELIATALAKNVAGQKLTKAERDAAAGSKLSLRVANELNAENIESGEYSSGWTRDINTERINAEQYSSVEEAVNTAQESVTDSDEKLPYRFTKNAPAKAVEATEGDTTVSKTETAGKDTKVPTQAKEDVSSISAVASKYGSQAEAVVSTYNLGGGTQDLARFSRDFGAVYDWGISGVSYEYATKAESKELTASLTEAQRELAYEIGRDAATAKAKAQAKKNQPARRGSTEWTEGSLKGHNVSVEEVEKAFKNTRGKAVSALREIAKVTGINIVLYKSTAGKHGFLHGDVIDGVDLTEAQGAFVWDNDTIYIDINAGLNNAMDFGDVAKYTLLRTFSHEFTHFCEKWNAEEYNHFRELVFDHLTRRGENVHELIEAKQEDGISYDKASREVVAEAMTDILPESNFIEELATKHQTLFEKLIAKLKEFLADIKSYFNGLAENMDRGASAIKEEVGDSVRYIEEIVKAYDKMAVQAVENYQAAMDTVNVAMDEDTESVSPVSMSLRTWTESEYVKAREKAAKAIAKDLGVSVQTAYQYIDNINGVAKLIADDRARLDYDPNMDDSATVIKPNSDYKWSVDMSTLCAKRLLFTGTFDAIQRRLPHNAFDSDDIVRIRGMMEERGYEVACGICYVESTRREIGTITADFIERYKEAQKTGKPITRLNSEGKVVELRKTKDQMETTADSSTNQFFADKDYTPTLADLNTTDIDLVKRDHPLVYEAYLNYMNARGQAKPKLLETRAEYKGEILKHFKAKSAVTSRNNAGGLRLQSFSDFEVPHLIDMMQITMDMARVGLKAQAYTKVTNFAEAFGNTGIKINLSLIAKGTGLDSNGNLIFDDKEGINHTEAFRLREKFSKNVGTILVGKNDAHIIAAMADPSIDYIIPFHKSSWKESLYDALGLTGYDDYTAYQNEKPIDKSRKISNFDPSEYWDFSKTGDENAQIYLEKCREDGRTPKFPQFQGYPGYWKLLIDFKMYDNDGVGSPQEVVQPIFDNEVNEKILSEYKGGHRSFPVAQDVVDDFVREKEASTKVSLQKRTTSSEDSQNNPLTNAEEHREHAVEEFGYTPHFSDAAYILPNGKMLNFIGKQGAHFGGRTMDHRAIKAVYPEGTDGAKAMNLFMGEGNIRIMAYSPGLELGIETEPTVSQYNTISRFIYESRKKGYFYVDFTDSNGENIGSLYYDKRLDAEEIKSDIKYYFQTGRVREQNRHVSYQKRSKTLYERDYRAVSSDITKAEADEIKKRISDDEADAWEEREGWSYRFYNRSDNGISPIGHAMFADSTESLEGAYGGDKPKVFAVAHDELVSLDENSTKKLFEDAWDKADEGDTIKQLFQDFEDFYNSFNPDDIVMNANAWDNSDCVQWVWDNICEPHEIHGFKTEDGAIVYNPDIIKRDLVAEKRFARITQEESVVTYQKRTNSLSDREVLEIATTRLELDDLTEGEKSALEIFQKRLDNLNSLQSERESLGELWHEQQFGSGVRSEAKATLERMHVLDGKIERAMSEVLSVEDKKVLKQVLQKARSVIKEESVDHYRAIIQRRKDRSHGAEMRRKIHNVVSDLNNLLLHGDKKNHVPESMKKAVAESLNLINAADSADATNRSADLDRRLADLYQKKVAAVAERDSIREAEGRDTEAEKAASAKVRAIDSEIRSLERRKNRSDNIVDGLRSLKDAYEEIQSADDPDFVYAYDLTVASAIDDAIKKIDNIPLKEMSNAQLQQVYDLYKMVLSAVRNANKSFVQGKNESISILIDRTISEVKKVGGEHDAFPAITEGARKFFWNNRKPIYAMEKIGSNTLTNAFWGLIEGEGKYAKDIDDASKFAAEQRKKHGYDKWDFKKGYDFVSTSGLKFKLTLEQIMSLYAYSKRDQAHDHLRVGGFVFDSSIETSKEKDGKRSKLKYKVNTANAHQISEEALLGIISKLSAEQIAFVDEMQDYLSTVMGAKGNEVSMAMYDVRLFKEKYYFPLKSAKQYMFEQNEVAGEVRIKNSGFTNKLTPGANNPVIMSNFMDVWASHVHDMSMYHSFVLPVEDFNRIFNGKTRQVEGAPSQAVKTAIQNAYGREAVDYVRQLIVDLNGGARADSREGIVKQLIGKFKKAAVIGSASVVIQQPSAIIRARAMIEQKYFDFNPRLLSHSKMWAEMKEYAPVAILKEIGHFDMDTGRTTVDYIKNEKTIMGKVDDALSIAPAKADEWAWVSLWAAVKKETAAKNPSLATSSKEFLEIAGRRFTEIIVKTQVYDSTLSRSAYMRSKSAMMGMVTAFMAEPTTTINMLEEGWRQFRKGNKRIAGRYFASVYGSVLVNSLLVSIVYAMRDDDEDETFLEKYFSSLTSEVADGVNPLTYFPWVKDVWSIAQGFDVERSDMSVIADVVEVLTKLGQYVVEDTSDMDEEERAEHDKKIVSLLWDFVDGVATCLGIPEKNVRRDLVAVYNTFKTVGNGLENNSSSMKDSVFDALQNTIPIFGWFDDESKTDRLYEAIINGDTAYRERIESSYEKDSEDETLKAIQNATRKALKENDQRITEMATAWINGEFDRYKALFNEIRSEGNFSFDTIMAAFDSRRSELEKQMGLTTESEFKPDTDNDSELFDREAYFTAIINGDSTNVELIRKNLLGFMSEEDLQSDLRSECRIRYKAGNIAANKVKSVLVGYGGLDEAEADEYVQYWSFQTEYPEYDDLSRSAVTKYYDGYYKDGELYCAGAVTYGIDVDTYAEYIRAKSGFNTKEEIMAVIDSLNLTVYQKDALYLLNGWAKSTLNEAPW